MRAARLSRLYFVDSIRLLCYNNIVGVDDAWGNFTISYNANQIAANNPFTYRGYYYDGEYGFYCLGTRFYDPAVGRFINADSVMSGVNGSLEGYNLYAYCFNNPIMYTDSTGNWPELVENAKKWVDENIIQPVVTYFSPDTNSISGQFQDGPFKGAGALTGGYTEGSVRFQANFKSNKNNGMLGEYNKVSVGNANGKIGVGNSNTSVSLKGVGDGLTLGTQYGIQYKNGFGLATKAKASALSGRATMELDVFGHQVEFGVSADLLSVGAECMVGIFPNEGFTTKASIGAGVYGTLSFKERNTENVVSFYLVRNNLATNKNFYFCEDNFTYNQNNTINYVEPLIRNLGTYELTYKYTIFIDGQFLTEPETSSNIKIGVEKLSIFGAEGQLSPDGMQMHITSEVAAKTCIALNLKN